MKKFFSVMLLAFCLQFVINFFHESKANAADVYMGQYRDNYNGGTYYYYVDPDNFTIYGSAIDVNVKVIAKTDDGRSVRIDTIVLIQKMWGDNWLITEPPIQGIKRGKHLLNDPEYSDSFGKRVFYLVYPKYKNRIEQQKQEAAAEEAKRKRIEAEKERIFNNLIAEGDKFYNTKNYGSAKTSYAKARTENSSKIENLCNALINNGNKLKNEKNFVAAIDYFRKAFVMGSNKAGDDLYESLVKAGSAARANKNFDDAIKLLNEAINFQPNNSWAYNNLGITYKDIGEYDKAIEQYNKALQISPNYKYVYGNRAFVYRKLGDYDNAIADYKKTLSLDSNYSEADSGLWDVYCESKKFDDAVKYYSQKISKNKADSLSYFRLGLAYQNLGNNKKAIEYYKKSLKIDKNYTEAKEALAKISSKK